MRFSLIVCGVFAVLNARDAESGHSDWCSDARNSLDDLSYGKSAVEKNDWEFNKGVFNCQHGYVSMHSGRAFFDIECNYGKWTPVERGDCCVQLREYNGGRHEESEDEYDPRPYKSGEDSRSKENYCTSENALKLVVYGEYVQFFEKEWRADVTCHKYTYNSVNIYEDTVHLTCYDYGKYSTWQLDNENTCVPGCDLENFEQYHPLIVPPSDTRMYVDDKLYTECKRHWDGAADRYWPDRFDKKPEEWYPPNWDKRSLKESKPRAKRSHHSEVRVYCDLDKEHKFPVIEVDAKDCDSCNRVIHH